MGYICINCSDWFEVVWNTGSPGLCFCPLCGYEFEENDFDIMECEEE